MIWQTFRRTINLEHQGCIMGILNVTPDSFSDGGKFIDPTIAVHRALQMEHEGAAIIDIGGESTRPSAPSVPVVDELARVLPVIQALRAQSDVIISIDTMKPEVAAAAIAAGADIINDVGGFREPAMRELAARTGAGCVIMHMQGNPQTMQQQPAYENVVHEVQEFFAAAYDFLRSAGVHPHQIVFDPGIGFGKRVEHNRSLLLRLSDMGIHHRPILLGVSRKSFLSTITGNSALSSRNWPTVALTSYARHHGVRILRVHDILPNYHALRMTEAIMRSAEKSLASLPTV